MATAETSKRIEAGEPSTDRLRELLQTTRKLTLKLGDRLRLFNQLAAYLRIGYGATDFFRAKLREHESFAKGGQDRRAFVLSGRPRGKAFIEAMNTLLDTGLTLAGALGHFPRIFTATDIAFFESGEETGELEKSCLLYLERLEELNEQNRSIRELLAYPAAIIVVGVVVVYVLMVTLIPGVSLIYEALLPSEQLPAITRAVIAASLFAANYWWAILVVFFGAVGVFVTTRTNENWRAAEDRLLLSIPVVNRFAVQRGAYNFLQVFVLLYEANGQAYRCAELAARSVPNRVLRRMVQNGTARFVSGDPSDPAEAIALECPYYGRGSSFHVEVSGFATVGVEPLKRYSKLLREELESTRKTLNALLNPVMISLVGVVIGIIVISAYLPMFQLFGKLAH